MINPDRPSHFVEQAHAAALSDPQFDWANRQDFDFASRGLIHRTTDALIETAEGGVAWHHHAFETFLHGDAPTSVHPSLWRHALLNNFRGLFKVTEGVYQVRGESLANVTFVETDSGYIVIDPLNTVEVAAYALKMLFDHVGERPIRAVIYSHTHSDHFGGVKGVITEESVRNGEVRIFASAGFMEWVLKEQGLAAEGMGSRNAYMYGEILPVDPRGLVDTGLGQAIEGGDITLIEPTDIIGPDGGSVIIDGIELQFMYAPGEAPTGMHTYIPKYRTLHVADNCYMCMHNVYTIRGAFPRDAMQWADSVARSLLFSETEFLVSGHNWPVFGREEVRTFLGQQRDGIKYMHDQTLRLMSHGYVPSEIADRINFPPSLARLWHLRGYYGTLKHNVRGIYTYYLGWYDGNPAHLDELPPRQLAAKMLEYMGGIDAVLGRARDDFARGEYRWVVYVVDFILWAEPEHTDARALAAAAHTQLGYGAENATWRNAYLTAAQEMRHGVPESEKGARVLRDVVKGMPVSLLLTALSVRLNGPEAIGDALIVNWDVVDTDEQSQTELSNCVLVNRDGSSDAADVTVRLDRLTLSRYVLGEARLSDLEADAEIVGPRDALVRLDALLDRFPAWFPVATHGLKAGEG
ncbi:MAG: alkyl sulfatase dimerization domain-containing protein [Pseudomonadota bacterium]